MLSIGSSGRIFLVSGATDMRKSFDTLAAIITGHLEADPYTGDVYVFCNGRRNRVKALVWETSGFWLCAKRLEQGTFAWPQSAQKSIDVTREELTLLLGGIDLEKTRKRPWYERPQAS